MVGHGLQASFVLAASFGLSGCCKDNEENPQPGPRPPSKPKLLVFSEDDEFYRQLDTALDKGRKVSIRFDGKNKIGKDSKLLNGEFLGRFDTGEFWKGLHSMDTSEGRQLLETAFDSYLLGHKTADAKVVEKSDNVIAPAVVVLIVVLQVLTAVVVVAKERAKMRIKVTRTEIELEVEPASAPRA